MRGTNKARPAPSRRLLLIIVAILIVIPATGAIVFRSLLWRAPTSGPSRQLVVEAAVGRVRASLASERQVVAARAAAAAAIPELRNAAQAGTDGFTLGDLLKSAAWWQPDRELPVVIFDGNRLLASRNVPDLGDGHAWRFWQAGSAAPALGVATAVVAGTEHAYLAAATPIAPEPGASLAAAKVVLVLALPIDHALLGRVADRAHVDALLVSNGKKRLGASSDYAATAPSYSVLVSREAKAVVGLGGDRIAIAMLADPGAWFWVMTHPDAP